ncbi:MAG: hypothetical protein DI613_07665 [Kocuria rhizophila]|nr:MAG: hypothetical protein DI613_07665 [Kocuria rhizophila]
MRYRRFRTARGGLLKAVLTGLLVLGLTGTLPEFGHTFVRTAGKTCHCGATGCLETEVSQSRLFELAGGDASQLEQALKDSVAKEVARQLGYLAIALLNAVKTFNSEAIILDGFLGILYALSPRRWMISS